MNLHPSFDALAGPLDPPVREPAIRAAFERLLAQGCLLERLSELATAEDFRWRAYRAVVLGKQGAAEDLKALVAPLSEDPHGFVRACCAWALGRPSAPSDPLIDSALLDRVKTDPIWSVGRRAAISLGQRLPKEHLWALWVDVQRVPLLPWVRRGFVEALQPATWPRSEILRWLADADGEDKEALLWNMTPDVWHRLEVPQDVIERLRADPWHREQLERFKLSR